MNSRLKSFSILFLASSLYGSTLSVVGGFSSPGLDIQFDPFLNQIMLDTQSMFTVQTWSYGGGVNASGQVISSGGFDPIVSLFSGSGVDAVFLDLNDDGHCPPGMPDAMTGRCADSTLVFPELAPGEYTVALAAFENVPFAYQDPLHFHTLGDGFVGLGTLLDSNGQPRTSNFAFDIITASVPEPSTMSLVLVALLLAIFWARKLERARQGTFSKEALR
jgi:PEP-CTERM motif